MPKKNSNHKKIALQNNAPQNDRITTRYTKKELELRLSSSPIPDPIELANYEAVVPGLANRIVASVENQSAHRIEMEKKVIEGNEEARKKGQNRSFIITLVTIIAGTAITIIPVILGIPMPLVYILSGSIVTISGPTTLTIVFVAGKEKNSRDLKNKK